MVTRRAVAMKFLKDSVRHRRDLRERFVREATTASALKHPNVVEMIDVFDFREGSPVMVMELLQGETLAKRLRRDGRLSLEATAAVLVPVLSAVGHAHALNIVHRDLKPDSLFLVEPSSSGAAGTVKVLDFGIAQPSDHRVDIWSLGVILYECLAGCRPIEGNGPAYAVAGVMSSGMVPLERIAPELPGDVTELVQQLLARELDERTPSLLDVSRVLSRHASVATTEFAPPSSRNGWSVAVKPKALESVPPDPAPERRTSGAIYLIGVVVVLLAALTIGRCHPSRSQPRRVTVDTQLEHEVRRKANTPAPATRANVIVAAGMLRIAAA
jgi:serine/threonine protein kinase